MLEIVKTVIISILIIVLIHYIFVFMKNNLTTTKIKNLEDLNIKKKVSNTDKISNTDNKKNTISDDNEDNQYEILESYLQNELQRN